VGKNLAEGFERWIEKRPERDELLDNLLKAVVAEKTGSLRDAVSRADFVTWLVASYRTLEDASVLGTPLIRCHS
jgi:cytochrome P450